MGKKRLALVKTLHISEGAGDVSGKNAVTLVFNRPLHRLEAMAIAHIVSQDLEGTQ